MIQLKYFSFMLLMVVQAAAQRDKLIVVSNPSAIPRPDDLVVFKRKEIEQKIGSTPAFIEIKAKGKNLAVQHDDLDGDGKWDEAVVLYSFTPNEKVFLTITQSNKKDNPGILARAHVRLRKKNADDSWGPNIIHEEMPLRNPATDFSKQSLPLYLTEGPAWENDKVGFRLYFDVRNGKDIWGKRTSRMVLDSVGTTVEPGYHNLNDWGMDILHAGKSLGAGALALLVPRQTGDTLMRLGGDNIKRTVYEQIASGPLRAMFRISYDWEIYGKPVQVIEETSIWGGQYFYESKVWVKGAPAKTKLAIGIAGFYNNIFRVFDEAQTSVLLSHGQQSENKDYLGMAVLSATQFFSFAGSTANENSDVLNTYISVQDIEEGKPLVSRFYAGWEKTDPRFSSLQFFSDYIRKESIKMGKPLVIK